MAIKTNLTRAAIGAATAGAMLMSAAPAAARDRYDRDGISAGEIIAGAVVLGGLAAILSSGDNDRYDRYDDRYRGRYDDPRYGYGYNYNRYGNSRSAVRQYVSAVERGSRRHGRTDVTEVTDIDRNPHRYKRKSPVVDSTGYGRRWRRGGQHDRGQCTRQPP